MLKCGSLTSNIGTKWELVRILGLTPDQLNYSLCFRKVLRCSCTYESLRSSAVNSNTADYEIQSSTWPRVRNISKTSRKFGERQIAIQIPALPLLRWFSWTGNSTILLTFLIYEDAVIIPCCCNKIYVVMKIYSTQHSLACSNQLLIKNIIIIREKETREW